MGESASLALENLERSHSNLIEHPWIIPNSSYASRRDIPSNLTNISFTSVILWGVHRSTHHQYAHKNENIIQYYRHVKSIRVWLPLVHKTRNQNTVRLFVQNFLQQLKFRLPNIVIKDAIGCFIVSCPIFQF